MEKIWRFGQLKFNIIITYITNILLQFSDSRTHFVEILLSFAILGKLLDWAELLDGRIFSVERILNFFFSTRNIWKFTV